MTFEFCEKVDWLIYGVVGKAPKLRVQSQMSENKKCIFSNNFCGTENKIAFFGVIPCQGYKGKTWSIFIILYIYKIMKIDHIDIYVG